MCMTRAHGTTHGSAYALWWAMLCGTSTQTDRGCTRCPIFMRSRKSQPLSSALRLKNNTREQHECTNLMHSDLDWIECLLHSPVFTAQRRVAGRRAPDDQCVRALLVTLEAHHDRLA